MLLARLVTIIYFVAKISGQVVEISNFNCLLNNLCSVV